MNVPRDSKSKDSKFILPTILPTAVARLGANGSEPIRTTKLIKTMRYANSKDDRGRARKAAEGVLVPGRGLEPPRCYPLVPETSASTNSATRAGEEGRAIYARLLRLSIED